MLLGQDLSLVILPTSLIVHRDTSNAPVNITNSRGIIMLRKDNRATPRTLSFLHRYDAHLFKERNVQ